MKKVKAQIKTDYGAFPCTFTPDEVGYLALCPSVDGVVSWGKNLSEAKKMVKEAIELCVEAKVEENVRNGIASKTLSFKTLA